MSPGRHRAARADDTVEFGDPPATMAELAEVNVGEDAPAGRPLRVAQGDAAALAARYGLGASSYRPPLRDYIAKVWARRHFIISMALARTSTQYSRARLGQVWQVLTPLLTAAVYYLIFGILLNTSRGLADPQQFISFLVIGIFMWMFINRSINAGAKSIPSHLSLLRALHFPRACLPIAGVIVEFQHMLVSTIVMIAIVLVRGEHVTVEWLIFIPALALETLFCLGMALMLARIGARVPDVAQLLPFTLRAWMYASGIFYSINRIGAHYPGLASVMSANPVAVYVELGRAAFLHGFDVAPLAWFWAVFWAVLAFTFGFVFFWRAEARYGRG